MCKPVKANNALLVSERLKSLSDEVRAVLLLVVLRTSPELNYKLRDAVSPAGKFATIFSRVISLTVSELFMTLAVPLAAVTDRRFGQHLMLLFSLNLYVTNFLKNTFRLPRPLSDSRGELSKEEMGYGFPSLHCAAGIALPMFATCPVSPLAAPLASAPLALALVKAWPALIGFARMQLGVHSLPDVFGGWFIGFVLARKFGTFVRSGLLDSLLHSPTLPALVIPLSYAFALLHPRPRVDSSDEALAQSKPDSSVTESAIVLGCAAGTMLGAWRMHHAPHLAVPRIPAISNLTGSAGVAARFTLALITTAVSKTILKPTAKKLVDLIAEALGQRANAAPKDGQIRDCCARVLCYTALATILLDAVPSLCGR